MLELANSVFRGSNRSSTVLITEQGSESVRLRMTNSRPEEPSFSTEEPENIQIAVSSSNNNSQVNSGRVMEAEQGSFLRKTCAIFFAMLLWRVLAIGKIDPRDKLESLGIVTFCCLIVCAVENLLFCARQNLTISDYKERLFNVLDGVLGLYFLVAVQYFDEEEDISKYLLIAAPCLYAIITIKYIQLSVTSPIPDRNTKILIRLCATLQVSLVTAKLLGYIISGWMTVFMPLGFFLVGHQIYGSIFLIKASIKLFKRIEIENLSFIRGSLRMSWNVVHYGLLFLAFGIFIDLCNQTEIKRINKFMEMFLLFTECYSGLFLGYAPIFFKIVRELDPELMGNPDFITSRIKPDALKKKYSLVPQDGLFISSFLKISPTYFVRAGDKESEGQQEENTNENFKWNEAEENPCYICEENKPDIILMNCGHGGMCKNCALLSMKKNNCCMQCRKPTDSIYQIKKEDKDSGIVDACEIFNILY